MSDNGTNGKGSLARESKNQPKALRPESRVDAASIDADVSASVRNWTSRTTLAKPVSKLRYLLQ